MKTYEIRIQEKTNSMKEYFIHLKNLTTGMEIKLRKLLTPDQVKECIIGRVDKEQYSTC